MPEKQGDQTPCKFTLITGEPTELESLEKAGINEADSLIVGGIEKQDSLEADVIMLAMLLVLQDALLSAKRDARHPLHVVGQVSAALRTPPLCNWPGQGDIAWCSHIVLW